MIRRPGPSLALLAVAAIAPPAGAQTELGIEIGATRIGPELGVQATESRFAMGGLRFSSYGRTGSGIFASVLGGTLLGDSVGGDFLSGVVEGSLRSEWTRRLVGGLDVRLTGFEVNERFPNRTWLAEVNPSVQLRATRASLVVEGMAGMGRSSIELSRPTSDRTISLVNDLWRIGGASELLFGGGNVQFGIGGSLHRTSTERYGSVGARLVAGGGWGVAELRVDQWNTPLGAETTGGIAISIPMQSRWSFRGFLGRSDPDPLTLSQPGSTSGGGLLGWNVYTTATSDEGTALHEVVRFGDGVETVRFRIEAPASAAVALLGDFTLWEPVEMAFDGQRWRVELEIRAGTHHYGFTINDEWHVPDDATNVVEDEWGRSTATLVIEGAAR